MDRVCSRGTAAILPVVSGEMMDSMPTVRVFTEVRRPPVVGEATLGRIMVMLAGAFKDHRGTLLRVRLARAASVAASVVGAVDIGALHVTCPGLQPRNLLRWPLMRRV